MSKTILRIKYSSDAFVKNSSLLLFVCPNMKDDFHLSKFVSLANEIISRSDGIPKSFLKGPIGTIITLSCIIVKIVQRSSLLQKVKMKLENFESSPQL